MPRSEGPFEVLENVNDNAYKADLLGDFGVSATFNVANLSSYLLDGFLADLRIESSQQGDDDGVPSSQPNEDAQTGLGSLNSPSKVQRMTHILQRDQTGSYGFKADFKHRSPDYLGLVKV